MTKKKTKVDKLREQREKLNARIQKLEAGEKQREKKRDTRRKILVGSYYLDQAKKNQRMNEINKIMNEFLTRNSDRVLFDLEPID